MVAVSRSRQTDLSAERALDRVPEDEIEEGDIVRVAGLVGDEIGVVVSESPSARVALPDSGVTVRAESGPVIEILDHVDGILGVDSKGQYHLYRRAAREVVVQNVDGDVEQRQNLAPGHVNEWLRYVAEKRGWQTRSTVTDSRGWFG